MNKKNISYISIPLLYLLTVTLLIFHWPKYFINSITLEVLGDWILGIYLICFIIAIALFKFIADTNNTVLIKVTWGIIGFVLSLFTFYLYGVFLYSINYQAAHNTSLTFVDLIEFNRYLLVIPLLLAPIFEEIVFRRIAVNFLENKTKRVWLSASISALLFLLVHWQGFESLVYLFIGLILVWVYKKGGLISSIITHITLNIIMYFIIFI
ncbi:lysostaphin resistance A-like protein [Anaerobacillus isosaccharinicus]|uniref:CPBP family intramembrane metalloprotease n=1 Tax=Anaerobacillus isosaccharinicus TaxID=1532552 RepID=A0A1S2LPM9_9BACI|nr:type II CAAX endopeptidase family protein [Anaerobacillus isosaccharinicus]MBA5583983.1 CPBP family intramembrane metalloprotease [Anaerobacillus isosaccharinicus]QOY37599.1 CPBP family intramembrane metalloprotease [Anaerobacillus isosaccharinicus]